MNKEINFITDSIILEFDGKVYRIIYSDESDVYRWALCDMSGTELIEVGGKCPYYKTLRDAVEALEVNL